MCQFQHRSAATTEDQTQSARAQAMRPQPSVCAGRTVAAKHEFGQLDLGRSNDTAVLAKHEIGQLDPGIGNGISIAARLAPGQTAVAASRDRIVGLQQQVKHMSFDDVRAAKHSADDDANLPEVEGKGKNDFKGKQWKGSGKQRSCKGTIGHDFFGARRGKKGIGKHNGKNG